MQGAEIIQFTEAKPPVVREEMTLAIQEFCLKRNFEDSLAREEIARLERFDRVDAQRKSLLINMSRYYRDNPRADVAPGVLSVITLLSDNDKGACTLSQAQMAIILYRTRTTIAEAVTRLKASELVRSVNGKAMSYPVIPRAVTQSYNHLVWVVDALKIVATCPVEPTGVNLSRRADTCNTPVPSKRQVTDQTCRVEGGQPVGSTGHKFTKDNSEKEIPFSARERSTTIGRAAAAIAAGIASTVLPAAAAPVEPPAQVEITKPECWETPKARMDAGMNVHELRAQRQVWQTGTGLLEVAGEFKDELERMFPLVDLPQGLAIAAATVHISQGALKAMQEIRKRFAYQQSDMAAKQKRAEAYGKRDGSPRAGGSRPFLTPDEQQRERNRRFLDSLDLPTTMPRPADEAY